MVMPITSTKNFRLSSGFGVSSSMWPRCARSKIGSGCMGLSLKQRARQIVKQFVDREGSRNQFLLRGIFAKQRQRAEQFVAIELGGAGRRPRGTLPQHPGNLPDRVRTGSCQIF